MIALPVGVTFAKRTAQPECWIYDFRHILLGSLGRFVLTVLPDGAHTHISCELAKNPDAEITVGQREIFEPIGHKITDRLEQAFAHRADAPSQSVLPSPPSSTRASSATGSTPSARATATYSSTASIRSPVS